jgi:hypothetical protein
MNDVVDRLEIASTWRNRSREAVHHSGSGRLAIPYPMVLRAAVAFTSEHSAVRYLPAHRIC